MRAQAQMRPDCRSLQAAAYLAIAKEQSHSQLGKVHHVLLRDSHDACYHLAMIFVTLQTTKLIGLTSPSTLCLIGMRCQRVADASLRGLHDALRLK